MKLQLIEPRAELKPFIGKIWVLESNGRLPEDDMKLIVPNGMVKLIIPVKNGLIGKYEKWRHRSKEGSITLIGISDTPAIVDIEHDNPHCNIGIEFYALGAYRLFHLPQFELKNKIFDLEDVIGNQARHLSERLINIEKIEEKIEVIQSYLISQLSRSTPDLVVDYCLSQIVGTKGLIAVNELERKTGFSSRWLREKFTDKVGLSPKSISSVIRFMQFYEANANANMDFFKNELYTYFYDQAHFIKDFKRFTGMAPSKFMKTDNEFGHIFYKG
ncbi:helix-turn-helix domain-containing protein [Dyadobacter chenwenxiniae]|uniref:Helix-turn-helix domain-containing protein n=1 Tax=Dyadobacter chenwenxiniae TaxID=2906456 RepID=A0A9X1TNJ3_9BACT|nr:helix-turn-helix domain-containing protein [Dyadobacter chenwenxiniae]MCF0064603.1 helix-turn-helix domain-containing protein [Dyadobacter chenwenxiniae]UON84340.1 helix-turn-helix domain-containing protein [Dyadobacter chenwenxiniae]